MPENDQLLQAVLEKPDDDAPRLAYAAWCDQSRNPRGEFIRVQIALVRAGEMADAGRRLELGSREDRLLRDYRGTWGQPIGAMVDDFSFDRGFIEMVTTSARRFLQNAERLFALVPLRHLDLTEVLPVAKELFASPHLKRLTSLSMDGCQLTDLHLKEFAEAQGASQLRWLSVAKNHLGLDGADALARSPLSASLQYANFYGNPVDPTAIYAQENELIMSTWLPEEGKLLELRHGHLAWLRRNGQTMRDLVPDRFRLAN